MALSKTGGSAISYTPFNKTSFGYGSGEIAAAHSSLTNVKIVISKPYGGTHWDDTGHISTTGSGSASPSYNKAKYEWACEGSVTDVDAVLDSLDFFPPDFPDIRNWTTTEWKANTTNGTYANENPADTDAIPDTDFNLFVYDPDNSYNLEGTYVVTFDPTQPTFGKQRPYWSTEPTNEDLATTAHGTVSGGLVDIGTIAQGSDTDPLTIKCEFRNYGTSTQYSGSAYGVFTDGSNIFIGDKKPGTRNTTDARLDFTGTKAEVQAYLDNVRYYRMNSDGYGTTFDMFFTLSNGPVGSTLTKTVWFSDIVIGLTTVPTQSYVEDTSADWNFGELTTSNIPTDVDSYSVTVTLDSVGNGGVDTFGTSTSFNASQYGVGFTETFNSTTGVLSISHTGTSNDDILMLALRNLTFTPDDDFNSSFNMTVQLTYTGSSLSSSYTSATQTVAVSGTATEDISNHTTSHTYVEDNVYNFSSGDVPQIIHYQNSDFTVTFDMGVETGRIGATGTATPLGIVAVGNGVYTLTGTRDQVNTDLSTLYYIPAADYNALHWITFTTDRTSGTGHASSSSIHSGTFEMTGTPVGEYSITQLVDVAWDEDTNYTFDSGLQIIDTADEVEDSATFESHYIVACEMWNAPPVSGAFTDGTLEVVSTAIGSSLTIAGIGQGGDYNFGGDGLSISGTKAEVNTALQNLKFVPGPNYDGAGPWVWYYIQRVYDSVFITPSATYNAITWSYPPEVVTKFLSASNTGEFSSTQTTQDWEENVTKEFDSGLQIIDKSTENASYITSPDDFFETEYKVEAWMTDAVGSSITNYYTHGNLQTSTSLTTTPTGTGRGGVDFVMTGSKAELNAALTTMKFIPDVDYYGAGPIVWYKITRLHDSSVLTTNDASVVTTFTTNSATTNYTASAPTNIAWYEDQIKLFDSGIVITDKATENVDYGAYKDTTFTVTGRAKYTDPSSGSTAMNSATWGCSDNGGADVSGLGTVASVLTITGTKAEVNIAMANLKMVPSLDWIETDATGGSFWFEWNITRDEDIINYLNYSGDSSSFVGGTTTTPYFATVSGMTYNENVITKIFEGKDVGITETATSDPLHLGNTVTYQVEVEITGSNPDGTWGSTGSSTYISSVGTADVVNAELQALEFTPLLDSYGTIEILYKQTRYVDGGTTTVQIASVDLGDLTGTEVPSYYSGITGMGYVEDTVTSIFDNVVVGVAETASEHNPGITYSATLKIVPDTAGKWYGTTSATHTVTRDTVDKVNAEIKALRFHPTEEANDDFVIEYSQTRYFPGYSSVGLDQATDVEIGTVTGTAATEYAYGTANSNIQYYVPDAHLQGIDTSGYNSSYLTYREDVRDYNASSFSIPFDYTSFNTWLDELGKMFGNTLDVTLTPKQLTLNQNRIYQRPINITDVSPDSQYKIIFSGGTLLTTVGASLSVMDTGWQTITDLNLILDDGLYVTGINDTNDNYPTHGATHTANFTIHRKTSVGVETQISNGQLTYSFLTGAKLYHYDKSTETETRIDNKAVGETVTLDVNYHSPIALVGQNDQLRVKASDGSAWNDNSRWYDTPHFSDMITARIDNDAASNGTSSSEYSWFSGSTHYYPTNAPYIYSNAFNIHQVTTDDNHAWEVNGLSHFEPVVLATGITASENIGLYLWTGWGVKFKSGNQQNHSDYTITLSATGS